MSNAVQYRIFHLLSDLIPNLDASESRTHFAPPRVAGDMAVHCTIDAAAPGHLQVEIAHDQTHAHGGSQSWISFDVDTVSGTARVTRFQEGCHYSLASPQSDVQSARVNLYAANWLAVFHTLGRVFQPVDSLSFA
ncbi:conserved protein of unknown function (plasmid) [Paraburkholderia kururiensis]|uniref:hypothetical protein n=1 Tax=Paraburkholderia kururiensis TaxID=984307 RepID=UPI0039A67757